MASDLRSGGAGADSRGGNLAVPQDVPVVGSVAMAVMQLGTDAPICTVASAGPYACGIALASGLRLSLRIVDETLRDGVSVP